MNVKTYEKSMGATRYDVEKLIADAIEPQDWVNHVTKDLMKFWDKDTIYNMPDGLFPTYVTNAGQPLPKNKEEWPEEFKAAIEAQDTKDLIHPEYNYIRAHSRLTYAFGIAYHMTGNLHYLEICRKGAMALLEAFDGNYGMHVMRNVETGEWDDDYKVRTSQDLAYGMTGLGMYYFLTHDKTVLFKMLQYKDFIFRVYMDNGKGYLTWKPRYLKNTEVQIVAQLDQLYAYMLMVTPSLPEPYQTDWKQDMKKITDILITQFYSEEYGFFWGLNSDAHSQQLGTDHTDFGHSIKTFWVILKIGELLGDPYYINFARPKIHNILEKAYIEKKGSWARRFDENGKLDEDKEWWILAELDQACEILSIHDPSYYRYLNNTHRYWFDYMVDKENGEIWHYVDGNTNKPLLRYPKAHNWKTSLHSFEHALFGYMTASRVKGVPFELYYALPEWEKPSHKTLMPYMFSGNVTKIEMNDNKIAFMPDGNKVDKITFDSLH